MNVQASPIVPTLPGGFYASPELYRREQERIFAQLWTCVGLAAALPQAGDYLTTEVAGEPILVVRGQDGQLRAFLNVCRHRGARLCTEPCGRLESRVIQCPYHAWSYALDGRLIGAPNMRDAEGFSPSAYGLLPVALAVWEGMIWVNLASDPPRSSPSSCRVSSSGSATRRSSGATVSASCGSARPSPTTWPRTGSSSSRTSWSATTAPSSTRN